MEQIFIAGRIGADAESKEVGDNIAINFNVAVSSGSKDEKITTWYACTIWRKKDKATIAEHLKKGTSITILGRPKSEAWANKEGKPESRIHIDVDELTLQGSASSTN